MIYNIQIKVMPLKNLLDPQGKAVLSGLSNLGLTSIQDVRVGKHITLQVEADSEEAAKAIAKVVAINTLHTTDVDLVKQQLNLFLQKNVEAGKEIDLFISGENGDNRTLPFYIACETLLNDDISIVRYKHMVGDYATTPAIGLWYTCEILQNQQVPEQLFKKRSAKTKDRNILLYNNYKGLQHSFILVSG